jgi:hypothetical protein
MQAMDQIESKTASGNICLDIVNGVEGWFGDQEAVNGEYMQAMDQIESKTASGNICLDIVSGV